MISPEEFIKNNREKIEPNVSSIIDELTQSIEIDGYAYLNTDMKKCPIGLYDIIVEDVTGHFAKYKWNVTTSIDKRNRSIIFEATPLSIVEPSLTRPKTSYGW